MSNEHVSERSKQSPRTIRRDLNETAEPLRLLPHQLYRFADLVERKILTNRAQLKKMIERDGFPLGSNSTPQTRAWRAEDIERWPASRPTEQIKPRGRAGPEALVDKASAKNAAAEEERR